MYLVILNIRVTLVASMSLSCAHRARHHVRPVTPLCLTAGG